MQKQNYPGSRSCRHGALNFTALAQVSVVLLLCVSTASEARLVRAGGRSGNSIISNATFAGTVPFLVEDPNADDNSERAGVPGTPLNLDLSSAAAYGYGPIGFQSSVSHDWGRDCALNTECFFELGASEFMDWQGHIIGLPEVLGGGDSYDAVADLRVTWEFLAVEEPDPDVFTTGSPPSRSLGPDFVWSSLFSANADGSFAPGFGSPSVTLGESLGYLPAPDEFSGCFTPYPAGPPVLPLAEAYSRGDCRELGFDLSQETGGPTGADLQAALGDNEYLSLLITTELIAPEDYQFANLFALGGPTPIESIMPGATGIPTPESLRALESVEYAGCVGRADSNCDVFSFTSQLMRVNVVDDSASTQDVPAPATLFLVLSGAAAWSQRRRKGSRRA